MRCIIYSGTLNIPMADGLLMTGLIRSGFRHIQKNSEAGGA